MGSFDFSFSRRCIAVDLGQSRIKAILAERKAGRVEVLHAFTLDLQEEGLLTMEEANRHLRRILLEMGDYPISLVIPQHIAISHLISLPAEGRGGWERMVEAETQKLVGLSESTIVYDYFRLHPFRKNRNPVWVTVARERDLDVQLKRVQGPSLTVAEVTNAGNALASAYLATQPSADRVVLADIGAASTTVILLDGRQPVYATSFPLGGELLTEAIASASRTGFEEGETGKKSGLLFRSNAGEAGFPDAIDSWHQQLQKVISEGLKEGPDPEEEPVTVMLSGGVSLQTGFLESLREKSPLRYSFWSDEAFGIEPQTYAVAYGGALAGLKMAPVRCSLLPRALRQRHFRARQITLFNALAGLLLVALFILLLADASVRRGALEQRSGEIEDLREAYDQSRMVTELLADRQRQYERAVPIVQQEKKTRDLLRTIGLMQRAREERELWFVLLADGDSYDAGTTVSTASPARPVPNEPRNRQPFQAASAPAAEAEAAIPDRSWRRFVLELSVPGDAWETHNILRDIVGSLAAEALFENVDTLAVSDRKPVANPAVTLPDQTYSLNLELAASPAIVSVDATAPEASAAAGGGGGR